MWSCYEAGRDGFWLHRLLASRGVENVVIDSASIEVNRRSKRAKTDRLDVLGPIDLLARHVAGSRKPVFSVVTIPPEDAEDLRHLGRELNLLKKDRSRVSNRIKGLLANQGPSLLKPIVHRGVRAQRDRNPIQARDGFVRARTQLVNRVRVFAKALGARVPASSTEAFAKRVRATTPMDLFPGLETLLETIEQLTATIRQMDGAVERLCRERYPETELLCQLPGVGPITALYYVLTIEEPGRFAKSRSVGAYLGLRPKRRNSGEQQPQLRITKAGDALLRRLLASAAHYILGPIGPDTDLQRAGFGWRSGVGARRRSARP